MRPQSKAEVDHEGGIDLAANLTLRVFGNTDSTRLRDSLQPCGEVDAVAKDIGVIDDNVADVNADAEFDPRVLRHAAILCGHAAQDLHRAAHCIYGAGELRQHAIARRLDDAPAMGGYSGVDSPRAAKLQIGRNVCFA